MKPELLIVYVPGRTCYQSFSFLVGFLMTIDYCTCPEANKTKIVTISVPLTDSNCQLLSVYWFL